MRSPVFKMSKMSTGQQNPCRTTSCGGKTHNRKQQHRPTVFRSTPLTPPERCAPGVANSVIRQLRSKSRTTPIRTTPIRQAAMVPHRHTHPLDCSPFWPCGSSRTVPCAKHASDERQATALNAAQRALRATPHGRAQSTPPTPRDLLHDPIYEAPFAAVPPTANSQLPTPNSQPPPPTPTLNSQPISHLSPCPPSLWYWAPLPRSRGSCLVRSHTMDSLGNLTNVVSGYDTGYIAGCKTMVPFLKVYGKFENGEWMLPTGTDSLLTSILSIGTCLGALLGSTVGDRIGRRWGIIFYIGRPFSLGCS